MDRLSLSGNTQELLSRGVGVNLERREPYDPILEASIGYTSAAAVAVMDEVAFVNERQDERMEGIEEGALSLVSRVVSVEEENCQLREVQRAQEERISRDGERIQNLVLNWRPITGPTGHQLSLISEPSIWPLSR